MKNLSEFDFISTPADWRNAVLSYQNSEQDSISDQPANTPGSTDSNIITMDSNVTDDSASIDLSGTNAHLHKRRFFAAKTLIIAAVLVVLSCISIFAYTKIIGYYHLQSHHSNGSLDLIRSDQLQKITTPTQKNGGLSVTCEKAYATDHELTFQIRIKSQDGSSLPERKRIL